MEHYCTLFDLSFLPQGMALHSSLERHAGEYLLWVLCMDEPVEAALTRLALPNVRILPIRDLETLFPSLLAVKPSRAKGEYCWTSTPFLPEGIFRLDDAVTRVTYLDADTFFFGPPARILEEFDRSGAHVLITDHFYPETASGNFTETAGRFNVQFMPFRNTEQGLSILRWWQDRCLEWCFARYEDGKFGDQKYLDVWPVMFGPDVHVLEDGALTLAPWNAAHLWSHDAPRCMFHYHNLRFHANDEVILFKNFRLSWRIERTVYGPYLAELRRGRKTRRRLAIEIAYPESPKPPGERMRRIKRWVRRLESWSTLRSRFSLA